MYIAGFVIPVPEEKMEAYRNMRPALTNLFHDPRHLLDCAICCIQPRRSKLRSQQMPAAENIERQITVAVVISVKEPSLLLTMHRIIRRIEVENNLVRRALMCL